MSITEQDKALLNAFLNVNLSKDQVEIILRKPISDEEWNRYLGTEEPSI